MAPGPQGIFMADAGKKQDPRAEPGWLQRSREECRSLPGVAAALAAVPDGEPRPAPVPGNGLAEEMRRRVLDMLQQQGVTAGPLEEYMATGYPGIRRAWEEVLQSCRDTADPGERTALLANAAGWSTGWFIHVPDGREPDLPLQVEAPAAGSGGIRRHLVVLGRGARADLVGGCLKSGSGREADGVTTVLAGPGARLHYHYLRGREAAGTSRLLIVLGEGAQLTYSGCALVEQDGNRPGPVVHCLGRDCVVHLNELILAGTGTVTGWRLQTAEAGAARVEGQVLLLTAAGANLDYHWQTDRSVLQQADFIAGGEGQVRLRGADLRAGSDPVEDRVHRLAAGFPPEYMVEVLAAAGRFRTGGDLSDIAERKSR